MLTDLLTVVVICYDPYIDAIELNPHFVEKFWKDRTAELFYVTSEIDVPHGFLTHKTHGNLSYYGRLDIALKNVKTKYVMLLLDDYIIDKKVDEKLLLKNIEFMEEKHIDYCEIYTMFSIPRGKITKFNDTKYLKISHNRKYRLSLQPSIFSFNILNDLLETKPSGAWEAELAFMDTKFDKYDAYFALNKSFSITNYIDKGEVTRKALRLLKREKLWKNQRKVISPFKSFKKWLINKFYNFVPQTLKDKIKGNDVIYRG